MRRYSCNCGFHCSHDFNATTTIDTTTIPDFTRGTDVLDVASDTNETYHYNTEWPARYKIYNESPHFQEPTNALNMWAFGRGWETKNARDEFILKHVKGWGEDTWDSIMMNMGIVKKVNGDSYGEIMEEQDVLINLKPMDPFTLRHVVNPKGILIAYDELNWANKSVKRRFLPEEIFHLCNNRIGNQIHGTSALKAAQWAIDAIQEAMNLYKRALKLSVIRIMWVDADDPTLLTTLKKQYKDAIEKRNYSGIDCSS